MTPEWGPRTSAKDVCIHFADEIGGRTILVTGVSVGGIGLATAQAIASCKPGLLIITGRNEDKLEMAKTLIIAKAPDVPIKLLRLDLNSLDATKSAAEEVLSWNIPVDVLINNAGLSEPELKRTADRHELHWGTNYLAPWYFTNLILPRIRSSTNKRVVNVASLAHLGGPIRWDDSDYLDDTCERAKAYGQSKTGNILFARALARRGVTAFSLHPGGILTPLLQRMPLAERVRLGELHGVFHPDGTVNESSPVWKTVDQGASTTCRAAFDPSLVDNNGAYLLDCMVQESQCAEHAKDPASVERLWSWTNQILGTAFA